jgi:trimeric autotransporter adhesin
MPNLYKALLLVIFICLSTFGLTQTPKENVWITNGTVYSTAEHKGNLYLGGAFSYIGPYTGKGVSVDKSTGEVFENFPKINGNVLTCIPDGNGGWFIGGEFTQVGSFSRNRIAHILPDQTVNPDWNPNADNVIHSIVKHNNTLYVGGWFSQISGSSRQYLAAIDVNTGNATDWSPITSSGIRTIHIANNLIYIGGSFSSVNSIARNNIAVLDMAGNLTSWTSNTDGPVRTIAVENNTVFIGGNFNKVNEIDRKNLASIDINTGAVSNWSPNANFPVNTIKVSNNTLFVGGQFNTISGISRRNLAAFDLSGNILNWNPDPDAIIYNLAIDNQLVYVAGGFRTIGGKERHHLAAIDLEGNITSWSPNCSSGPQAINVSNDKVFVGGWFESIGGKVRRNLASLNSEGKATDWAPSTSGTVNSLVVLNEKIYTGGNFQQASGQPRNNLACFDLQGTLTNWAPNPNHVVNTLKVKDNLIYIGGWFQQIGGQTRNYIAAIDENNNLAQWNPNANSGVRTIEFSENSVYAGGSFSQMGGQTRNRLAEIDLQGNLTSWAPNVDNTVNSIVLDDNGVIYIGGSFTQVNELTRNRIAAIDQFGNLTSWNPNANNIVYTLAYHNNIIYAGGIFQNIGGQSRRNLAALNINEQANATTWNPNPSSAIYHLYPYKKFILTGGAFTTINGITSPYFSAIQIAPLEPQMITFDEIPEQVFGNPPIILNASSNSGLPISYSITSGNSASLSGNKITILSTGTITIRASQNGDFNFSPAASIDRMLTINKASQNITFLPIENQSLENEFISLSASSNSGLDVSFELVSGNATLFENELRFTEPGSITVRAIQNGNNNYLPAEPIEHSFNVIDHSSTLNITIGTGSDTNGKEISIPVTVSNFKNILTAQFSIIWNPEIIEFVQTENFDLPSLNEANFGITGSWQGKLVFSWDIPSLEPVTLEDETSIFSLRFKIIGNAGEQSFIEIDGSPTPIEFTNNNFNIIPFTLDPGYVKVASTFIHHGVVTNEDGKPISGVNVNVTGSSNHNFLTNESGSFNFNFIQGGNYSINLSKNAEANPLNGITTLDIALIRRHILFVHLLESPYKQIAADVNSSGSITTLDISLIRNLILGNISTFPGGKSWDFIPAAYSFADPKHPFPFERSLTIPSISAADNINFIAVKLGDVNDSWNPPFGRVAGAGDIFFDISSNISPSKNSTIKIPISVSNFNKVGGFQFTLQWDPQDYDYIDIEENSLSIYTGMKNINKGFLTVSWDHPLADGLTLEDRSTLLTLNLKKKYPNAKSTVKITSDLTPMQAFDKDLRLFNFKTQEVGEDFDQGNKVSFALYQNSPNPVKEETRIEYQLPEEGIIQFHVLNSTGQIVENQETIAYKGKNHILWRPDGYLKPGLYYYMITYSGQKLVKKMIVK